MTTLIPVIFSWTLAFKSSYLAKPSVNIGVTLYIIKKSTNPKNISATRNIILNLGLIITHIVILQIIMRGALTTLLIII